MMNEKAARRLLDGESWDEFCDQLKLAGHLLETFGDEPSDQDRAEWFRYLTRMVRNGLERFVENCEPDRPRLRDAPWRSSINVQCPDQDHLLCEFVDGSHEYRIRGNRGTLPYFVMAVWTAPQPEDLGARSWASLGVPGLAEFDPTNLKTTSFLKSDDIEIDAEGNFEVIVSQKKPDGDWLPLANDSTGILVRTVHHDRRQEIAPTFSIERLDQPTPRPLRPDEMSAGLAKTGQLVLGYAELVRKWWQENLSKHPNEIVFSEATYLSNGGVLDRQHGFGTWQKPAADALVVEFTPPQCEYWILQVCNIWQENLDVYEDGQGYLTKFTARLEADGLVRVVIADADPGFGANWIDSFQHERGVFSLRLIQTEGSPRVTIYRVPLERLRSEGLAALASVQPILSGQVTD
ncbi:MAG: hypothetical protein V3T64_03990 [Myxococcota bacterium]